jgi:hypothetical protein
MGPEMKKDEIRESEKTLSTRMGETAKIRWSRKSEDERREIMSEVANARWINTSPRSRKVFMKYVRSHVGNKGVAV